MVVFNNYIILVTVYHKISHDIPFFWPIIHIQIIQMPKWPLLWSTPRLHMLCPGMGRPHGSFWMLYVYIHMWIPIKIYIYICIIIYICRNKTIIASIQHSKWEINEDHYHSLSKKGKWMSMIYNYSNYRSTYPFATA